MQNPGPKVQGRQQGLPQCFGHWHDQTLEKICTSLSQPIPNCSPHQYACVLSKTASIHVMTPPGLPHRQTHACPVLCPVQPRSITPTRLQIIMQQRSVGAMPSHIHAHSSATRACTSVHGAHARSSFTARALALAHRACIVFSLSHLVLISVINTTSSPCHRKSMWYYPLAERSAHPNMFLHLSSYLFSNILLTLLLSAFLFARCYLLF